MQFARKPNNRRDSRDEEVSSLVSIVKKSMNDVALDKQDPAFAENEISVKVLFLEPQFANDLDYAPDSLTAFLKGRLSSSTSDLRVAREAERTIEFLGGDVTSFIDVGVAGLSRLLDRIELISVCNVVIVVAGMDAAISSVVTALIAKPVIGVPAGWDMNGRGHALMSCA